MTDCSPARLGDYIQIKHGFAFRGEYFSDQGKYIVLTPGNFIETGGFKDKSGTEKYYTAPPPPEYVLKRGDLVIAMTEQVQGLLGSSALIPADNTYLHNQRIGLVAPVSPDIDLRYLYYLFNTSGVRNQIQATATGAKVRHTAPARVENVAVCLPPLPVQRKISVLLSAYDDLIENNHYRIHLLEEMALRVYREWFVDFRYPGHEDLSMVNSKLGPIPEGWDAVPFTEVADVLSGGTPKTSVAEYWDGDIPFFTPRDAPTSIVVTSTEKRITQLGLNQCNSQLYSPGTVFITARGTVGKVAMTGASIALNQSCYAILGRQGMPQEFILFLLMSQIDYLKTNTGGATFDTIIVDTFRRMHVISPARELVHAFARLANPIIHVIKILQDTSDNLRTTRDLLLPRLMSGDIAPPEAVL